MAGQIKNSKNNREYDREQPARRAVWQLRQNGSGEHQHNHQVNAQIPLNFNLPVSQNTQVVLTGDVSIPGAHVVINTGGLNINAQANVTLPAGTTLPIALNLDIPVQSTIPISLQVPVSIPMNQTELHEPFTGLQTSLRPLYCLFNKNAQYPEGMYICAEHDDSHPWYPMKKPYNEYTLPNGLKILLKEIHTAPLISSWVWYRVGSRDEPSGRTGICHWVEHMQFKGTPQFPASSLDRDISRDGGMWNAFTFMDWTAYLETMPADKIDLGLRLEADRMTNSLFDEKEVASERTVVISEREGNENEPLFRLSEAVQQAAFRVHPYHHEVIGDLVDLKSMSREDLYQHYRTYYVPNNAVLGVAGDFKTKEMLARIRELFEPIPAGPCATPPESALNRKPAASTG